MTTRRTGFAFALGFLLAALAAGASAQGTWHTETGPDRSYSVEMPVQPKYTAVPMKVGKVPYTTHQFLAEVGDRAFLLQYTIYPNEVDVSNPKANLEGGLDNAAKKMEGRKWANINWTTLQGLTAVEADGVQDKQDVRTYSVLKGRQIYVLTYAGPRGTARSEEVNRFLASFRINQEGAERQ